ncbi:MAG: hypothetical protein RBR41_10405 [Desulfovibrio sp.]|uniref:hypothetical protein n=1 Tax=Desulfovibrio sp. TaxID=885 RepID=UPI002A371666|nr:hypothetical protein [Desulfovibrio sp.]MDY0260059.1 hypothetical protein [Desulfovibrio sp.]
MKRHSWESTAEQTIERLQNELLTARYVILHLMPENLHKLLTSYYNCKSREDTYHWENLIAEKLLEYVEIIPYHPVYGRERAYCPLCGEGSDAPYEEGYALPEGLRRHIAGEGNTKKCPVVEQIRHLAVDHWDRMFAEKERLEREESAKVLEARRANETLYIVSPHENSKLIDEIGWGWAPHRDSEQLQWAESRLHELGVKKVVADRVVSYIYEEGELCIYANPIKQKNIEFCAYKMSSKRRAGRSHLCYVLPDRYVNGLRDKFEKYILDAKEKLKILK